MVGPRGPFGRNSRLCFPAPSPLEFRISAAYLRQTLRDLKPVHKPNTGPAVPPQRRHSYSRVEKSHVEL